MVMGVHSSVFQMIYWNPSLCHPCPCHHDHDRDRDCDCHFVHCAAAAAHLSFCHLDPYPYPCCVSWVCNCRLKSIPPVVWIPSRELMLVYARPSFYFQSTVLSFDINCPRSSPR